MEHNFQSISSGVADWLSWDHVDSKSDQALKSKQCKDWRKAECIAEYGFNHDPKRAADLEYKLSF
jgi:hypothetical protein